MALVCAFYFVIIRALKRRYTHAHTHHNPSNNFTLRFATETGPTMEFFVVAARDGDRRSMINGRHPKVEAAGCDALRTALHCTALKLCYNVNVGSFSSDSFFVEAELYRY